ncbi:transposase [Streptomyces sp. NPDC060031]|uniref:transposase n=1 Tax=Streptomyces sp. NPDC060031 TaxID=3347043 RepID=UPI0036994E73
MEPRRRMRDYVRGLLAPVARKNSWQLAEQAGHATPDGLQHLRAAAKRNPDDIRDDLQEYVADKLGESDGVLIVDDTGFTKKGTTSAGIQRQYSGTAGRTENCQIGVFAAYARPGAGPWSTASSTCPRPGPRTANAAARSKSPTAGVRHQGPTGPAHRTAMPRLATACRLGHPGRRLRTGEPLAPDAGVVRRRLRAGRAQVPVHRGLPSHRRPVRAGPGRSLGEDLVR